MIRAPALGATRATAALVSLAVTIAACGGGPAPDAAADAGPDTPALARTSSPGATGRAVAITFDDLPGVGFSSEDDLARLTDRLLAGLDSLDVPVTGFVNEGKLHQGDAAARTDLLRRWVAGGHDLGNHTYDHADFWDTPLDEMRRQVLQGDSITERVLAEAGREPRYFRHPYLNTGPTLEAKRAFERFLDSAGYTVAPVTIDTQDYIYAALYADALRAGDDELARRLAAAWLENLEAGVAFYEELARETLGREPAQILLLHANHLNADHIAPMVQLFRDRGYRLITVQEALEDPAYDHEDSYTGRNGTSWLQRWAITDTGDDPGPHPGPQPWVAEAWRSR